MSDDPKDEEVEEVESPALSALLKRSLAAPEPDAAEPAKDQELLLAVQKKLRQRSKGKFYADGWSTTESRLNYVLIAVAMLLIIAIAFFALGPMGISAR